MCMLKLQAGRGQHSGNFKHVFSICEDEVQGFLAEKKVNFSLKSGTSKSPFEQVSCLRGKIWKKFVCNMIVLCTEMARVVEVERGKKAEYMQSFCHCHAMDNVLPTMTRIFFL